jgi:hypothetical protein
MREPRNPFRLRAAEQIESDMAFLRLFGPGMLDLVQSNQLWTKPQIIRSAAGGGKTSLLKLLTPSVLLTLHANRANEEVKDLYYRMSEFEIISESGPRVLGIFLPCTRNYASLDDLEFEPARKERLFLGLLSARIALAALRSCLALRRLAYPKDLGRIRIQDGAEFRQPGLPAPVDGRAIHEWATRLESSVCDALDSFDPIDCESLPGQETVTALDLLQPNGLRVDDEPPAERIVLMLDDVHYLTKSQRRILLRSIGRLRGGVACWIAERFEALGVDELLGSGLFAGRDYEVISIEQFWRLKRKKFETLALNVGDRRARASTEVEISTLESCLEASLDSTEWQEKFTSILGEVEKSVRADTAGQTKFDDWLRHEDLLSGTTRDRATSWRTLEILVHRERRHSQPSFDFTLPADELEEKQDSQIRAAAELFIAHEYKLPYYFGPSRLAALASSNMEQYLWLAGDEFEEVISAAVVRKPLRLSAGRQDHIVRAASQALWQEIPRRVREGNRVQHFLEAVAAFCQFMTYQANAPYDPGVTGIAISMADRAKLVNEDHLLKHPQDAHLADVLASAIGTNLLEPTLDYRCKGSMWMVLNLNRLLCPKLSLPLQYGGFKEKTLDELHTWLVSGFKAPPKVGALL